MKCCLMIWLKICEYMLTVVASIQFLLPSVVDYSDHQCFAALSG